MQLAAEMEVERSSHKKIFSVVHAFFRNRMRAIAQDERAL